MTLPVESRCKPHLPQVLFVLFAFSIPSVGRTTVAQTYDVEVTANPTDLQPIAQVPAAVQPTVPVGEQYGSVQQASGTEAVTVDEVKLEIPSKATINEQIKKVTDSTDLSDELRAECLKRLNKALEWHQAKEEASARIAEYQAAIQNSGNLLLETKQKLAEPSPAALPRPPQDAELSQLEQQLANLESTLKESQAELVKREDELKKRGERKTQLASLVSEASTRLEQARITQQTTPAEGEDPMLSMTRSSEIALRVANLEKQIQMYRVEGERHEKMSTALPLLRDLAAKNVAIQEQQFAQWQNIVAERRKLQAEMQAREARRQVEQSHPALRMLAERNVVLAEERAGLASKLTRTSAALKVAEDQAAKLKQQHERATERVGKAGHTTTVGIMLRAMRDKLPSLREHEERTQFVSREMPTANLQRLELEEERSDLGHLDGAVEVVAAELDVRDKSPEYVNGIVKELLGTKRDLLDQLLNDYDTYLENLSKLEVADRDVFVRRQEIADFVDEHVLWIQSTETLGIGHFRTVGATVRKLTSIQSWGVEILRWWNGIRTRPSFPAAIVLAGILLPIGRVQIRRRLKAASLLASGRGQLSFTPTAQTAMYTLIMGSQWALVTYGLGFLLIHWDFAGETGIAVGHAMTHTAFLLWITELGWQICRSGGLAEVHFDWTSNVVNSLRNNLQWFRLTALPALLVSSFAGYYNEGELSDSLGRVAFILLWTCVGILIHRVLRPKSAVARELAIRNEKSWLHRLWNFAYLLSLMLPVALIGLAIIGFHFSAQELAVRFETTLALVLTAIVVHALVSRWVLMKRRMIAVREAREAQQMQSASNSAANAASPPAVPNVIRRDLKAIHEQIRVLLGHAMTIGLIIGMWFTWANVFPALRALDNVKLWTTTVQMSEIVPDEDGNSRTEKFDQERPTTLRHALIAMVIFVAAYAMAKNLPALLEFTVLDRLPIDGGSRHASVFLLRYTISLTAILMACRSLQITWSSVQWLAAAMTVGLGFGLQEIFANLVSGLIILFERPIRIGDLVTVGQVTGTVTSMKMRATTITDFDRRELVVPNKKFITEDVMNWTLSDPVSRVVIPVGIAYGSDTALAHSLLMQIAEDNPLVMADPAPSALFKGFGDSTLNFDLRVFLANRDVYPVVVHELNSAIDRAFRDHKIEIAFPQRDINIRSVKQISMRISEDDAMNEGSKAA